MPSVDFNWQEGDEAFSNQAEEIQPPKPQAFAPPSPQASPTRRKRRPSQSLFRSSNIVLLLVGIALGIGVGFAILTFQGQYNARADLAPVVELQYQALAQNDQDLYNNLIDPEDDTWRELLAGAFPVSSMLYDFEAGTPRVTRVELKGNRAEVEIESAYETVPYRRLETMRLVNGQWRLTRINSDGWGEQQTIAGENVILHFRERDDFVADYLPHIESVVQAFCQRYAPPPPCQLDLSIEPNPELLPFKPGEGAMPLPPRIDYMVMNEGASGLVTVNGTGDEIQDADFQRQLLEVIDYQGEFNEIHATQFSTPAGKSISDMRLNQGQMPLEVISPRLVGLHGDTPHPLWWLMLHESIGDVIMRRSVGTITAPALAANTAWAIARGDVAVWAERLSGVRLPETDIPIETDPVALGEALLSGDVSQRNAARSLALYLHYRDMGNESDDAVTGELVTLAFLKNAHNTWDTNTMFDILETNPRRLAAEWADWMSERE